MAKFIEDIHKLYNLLAGKNIATKQPPERIDQVLYEVTIGIFNDHYNHYVKTQKISDYMLPFKRVKTLTLTAGKATITAELNYAHSRGVKLPDGTKVDVVEDKFWAGRVKSKVDPPSASRPICRIENTEADATIKQIELVPSTITSIQLYYFKIPAKAKYAYTPSGNRYIYDENNSIDSEFSPLLFPQIAMKVLSRFGINLREQQVIQYAEAMKQQENVK